MTRMTCHVCGKPADGLIDISRSRGERIPDVSAERIYLCSEHIDCKVMVNSGQPLTTLEIAEVTYYGVWSGEEWGFCGNEIFHTTMIGLARAQAVIMSRWWPQATWEARAIGEDGLPVEKISELFEVKREFLKCAMAKCAMCSKPAKEWVDVRIRGWVCEQHSHVSVGCLLEKEES